MKVLVTGARGFLGQHVCRLLEETGVAHVAATWEHDLQFDNETAVLFSRVAPTHVIHCASYSGGIGFNAKHQADIWRRNLEMSVCLLHECVEHQVHRLVLPISNCAYPGNAMIFRESEIHDGPVHPSVLSYGMTRRTLVVGAEAYRQQYGLDTLSVVLPNMYGPGDHLDEVRAHALGAMVVRLIKAKRAGAPSVAIWGTGKPVREWLYVEDGARALVAGLTSPSHEGVANVTSGEHLSVRSLAASVAYAVDYRGELTYDTTKPDGALCKTMASGAVGNALLGLGPTVSLEEGLRRTVAWAEGAHLA